MIYGLLLWASVREECPAAVSKKMLLIIGTIARCVDEEHPSVVNLEEWLTSLPFFTENAERGKIDNLMESARKGRLWDSNDAMTPLKPITSDPELFELRRTALSKALRFYHAEPEDRPTVLLALHRHIKTDTPSQQAEINYAIERYRGD